jgi:peptidoglycan/xylan/chitin deacetylase (PgdA/CDA1 family)
MKKLSIVLQWVLVASLAAFITYILVRPTTQPDYAPETWQDWDGVTVLSYAGIARSDSPAYPSVHMLEAQLTALRDAGYRTVLPEDVRAYLDERAPLPKKALLLIFEGGRKEAFIRATPVLQRTGFMAVIAVPTTVMSQWGGFYLKRKDVAKIVQLPQWQVGSMGHQAIETVPGKDPAEHGHFLSHRTRPNGKEETTDAFRERILQDYARSAKLLGTASGKPASLYLYPFGAAGQNPGSDPLAEAANRAAVTRYFDLAFIGGANAFNGPGSDPWSLTRLRVPGDWVPERLLAELASSQPRNRPQDALGTDQDWVFERDGEMRKSELHLAPGALAWLRGTDAWTDVDVSTDLQPDEGGSAALYARYTSVRSWLRVTVDAAGLRVQERLGDRLFTLCRRPGTGAPQAVHHIRLRIRNNRAWVWLNTEAVAENLPLSPNTRRGRIGFGSDQGVLRVSAFTARPLPARWLLANSIRLLSEVDREQVQAILPTWFRAGEKPSVAQTAQQDLLQTAVAGIHTVPVLTGGVALDQEVARDWAAVIDAELNRANLKMLTPTLAVEGPAFPLAAELRNRNYRVTFLLSPEDALEWGRSVAQLAPEEVIVVNGLGAEATRAITWLKRVIPTSRLALREAEGTAIAPNLPTVRLYDSNTDR